MNNFKNYMFKKRLLQQKYVSETNVISQLIIKCVVFINILVVTKMKNIVLIFLQIANSFE